jgi:hypothetical protein
VGKPIKLYHYCKLSTALEYILPSMQLRLSPLTHTNDPRENKDFVFASFDWSQNINNNREDSYRFCKTLRNDCKLICFSRNGRQLYGWELSRLWATYGDRHQGICLEFDMYDFIDENRVIAIKKGNFSNITYFNPLSRFKGHIQIDYPELERLGEFKYLRNNFRRKYKKQLYFTKTKEWQSEQEVRLIYFSDFKNDEFCSIKKSLRRIFLGVDFKEQYKPSLEKLFDKKIIKLKYHDGRLKPEDGVYE